ncbi:MAG: sulfatase [Deinococcota bacterium]
MRIIYIDIDSLRPDHLGCYGYARSISPNIDQIAKRGVRFDHYYCADSPCMPSRHNFVTGRFGINSGVVTHGGAASKPYVLENQYGGPKQENQLLQRVLRERNIDTIAFTNFAWRHCATWFSFGWSEFHSPNLEAGDEQAHEVTAPVLHWLDQNAGRDDFFLYVNFWDPHCNYHAPIDWFDRVREMPVSVDWPTEEVIAAQQTMPLPKNGVCTTANRLFRPGVTPPPSMPELIRSREDVEHLIDGYDAQIMYTDHHIGQLLGKLEAQGVLVDTAVIISADHGEAQGEHGIYKDHYCAHECVHRVPLILSWPGLTDTPSTNASFLYNVDLSATLIDLLGGEVPAHYDGTSFAGGLRGGAWPDRDHLVWGHGLHSLQRCVRTRDYALLTIYHDGGFPLDEIALYDMVEDPHQTTNLATSKPEVVQWLKGVLAAWLEAQKTKPYHVNDPYQTVLTEWAEQGVERFHTPQCTFDF